MKPPDTVSTSGGVGARGPQGPLLPDWPVRLQLNSSGRHAAPAIHRRLFAQDLGGHALQSGSTVRLPAVGQLPAERPDVLPNLRLVLIQLREVVLGGLVEQRLGIGELVLRDERLGQLCLR